MTHQDDSTPPRALRAALAAFFLWLEAETHAALRERDTLVKLQDSLVRIPSRARRDADEQRNSRAISRAVGRHDALQDVRRRLERHVDAAENAPATEPPPVNHGADEGREDERDANRPTARIAVLAKELAELARGRLEPHGMGPEHALVAMFASVAMIDHACWSEASSASDAERADLLHRGLDAALQNAAAQRVGGVPAQHTHRIGSGAHTLCNRLASFVTWTTETRFVTCPECRAEESKA